MQRKIVAWSRAQLVTVVTTLEIIINVGGVDHSAPSGAMLRSTGDAIGQWRRGTGDRNQGQKSPLWFKVRTLI